ESQQLEEADLAHYQEGLCGCGVRVCRLRRWQLSTKIVPHEEHVVASLRLAASAAVGAAVRLMSHLTLKFVFQRRLLGRGPVVARLLRGWRRSGMDVVSCVYVSVCGAFSSVTPRPCTS
ncbi:unnamed protein product, partial [Hapterophycus canaliculatus]